MAEAKKAGPARAPASNRRPDVAGTAGVVWTAGVAAVAMTSSSMVAWQDPFDGFLSLPRGRNRDLNMSAM
ncbi:hypothetical protein GCM10010412_064450 [Nonomuraea recticatena]|uniref:Uncharacterized protein n=1 Tax=Nonomuraea recticatena TaxID=46178 RepID=A0ABP6F1S9_9ACTN